jgi:hypothetical protein
MVCPRETTTDRAPMSTNHIDPDLAAEVFVLDAPVNNAIEAAEL